MVDTGEKDTGSRAATADSSESSPGVARAVARVLVIEEERSLLAKVVGTLEGSGLDVFACANVLAARKACRQHRFDLWVLDWVVEGLFADELITVLRTEVQPRPLPPVIVLSRLNEEDTRACLRPDAPIHSVLTRPVDSRRMVETSARILDRSLTWAAY